MGLFSLFLGSGFPSSPLKTKKGALFIPRLLPGLDEASSFKSLYEEDHVTAQNGQPKKASSRISPEAYGP